jgi:hypothetical protein
VTEAPSTERSVIRSGWLSGIVLGAANGFALLELGVIGLGFTILSLLLIAWKGPRLIAAAGLVTGAGGVWTLLFGRVMLSCTPSEGCDAEGIGSWVAIAIAILAIGLVASFAAVRQSARRP